MGRTRDSLKKIRETKGTFMQRWAQKRTEIESLLLLTEVEEIKKRWQEYTELYKKSLSDPNNYDCLVTHLEPDILDMKSSGP